MRLLALAVALLATPAFAADDAAALRDEIRAMRRQETPEAAYNKGVAQMKRGYYDEAVISFQKVRNHFPFNQYTVLAELREADCLYEKASYVEAVDAYLRFQRLHPRHPEIDYVVYRTARAEMKLAPLVPQRDQAPTTRGLRRVARFEERFPDSEYLAAVQQLRRRGTTRLGRAALQIGNFYWKQGEWGAAERRYRLAAEEYPESAIAAKARYRQARCLLKLGRGDDARTVFEAVVTLDGEGRWGRAASRALTD